MLLFRLAFKVLVLVVAVSCLRRKRRTVYLGTTFTMRLSVSLLVVEAGTTTKRSHSLC